MMNKKVLKYIDEVLVNMPTDWLSLTTHRLDIYDEKLAKTQFLDHFETLFKDNKAGTATLNQLPTAYDYIRLGHPLSSILEWGIAHLNNVKPENVISFSSQTIPVLAILRKNLFDRKNTQIVYKDELPDFFDFEALKLVYGYNFELKKVEKIEDISGFKGSTVFISPKQKIGDFDLTSIPSNIGVDFFVSLDADLGSILLVNGNRNERYISDIQHVRRRETIAMTPDDCLSALQQLIGKSATNKKNNIEVNKASVVKSIHEITATKSKALIGSSGLSVQYAIMMGLIDEALEKHKGKAIKIIVPPNCYGGTNDQARRVAAGIDSVEIVDLPVDGDNDMVQSIARVLDKVASEDAVPFIIAEIPTNPRVEVPDLMQLKAVLSARRETKDGAIAIDPVFILDQTFCPNVQFLSESGILSTVRSIAYVSGSKFPSGGQCTAGYCVANKKGEELMDKIDKHLRLCDNEATGLQMEILAKQLPSMNQRIADAYKNTREFVNFIAHALPEA
ncbi:MAG: cystathionine beta-lyase/cystathionine gamma-synthase, partial [Marivirga sp.]